MPLAPDGRNILIKCVVVDSSIYSGRYQQSSVALMRGERILVKEGVPRAVFLSVNQGSSRRKSKEKFLKVASVSCLVSSILTQMALAEETTFEVNVGMGGWSFAEMLMNQVKIRDVVLVCKYREARRYQKTWRSK